MRSTLALLADAPAQLLPARSAMAFTLTWLDIHGEPEALTDTDLRGGTNDEA